MKRKMLREERELRKLVDTMHPKDIHIITNKDFGKAITALVKAVREDCIEVYYDWEARPKGKAYENLSFPDALRKNIRWGAAAIRGGKG